MPGTHCTDSKQGLVVPTPRRTLLPSPETQPGFLVFLIDPPCSQCSQQPCWRVLGQKLRDSIVFTGLVFTKGREFILVFLGEGFGVGFRCAVGAWLSCENEGKGEGVGRVGIGKETRKSMGANLSKRPFSKCNRLSTKQLRSLGKAGKYGTMGQKVITRTSLAFGT